MSKNKKNRVLFIHHGTGWGGASNCLIKLINGIDKSLFDVEVLLLKDSIVSEKLKENHINYKIADSFFFKKVYKIFPHSEAGYLKWFQFYALIKHTFIFFLSRYYFAPKELKRFQFDIAHLNSTFLVDWLAPSREIGKVILHVREPFRRGHLDLIYILLRYQMNKYANQIIAISKDNAERIDLSEKTNIIYDPFEKMGDNVSEKSYSSKKVLYLGGAARIKGFKTMVDSLQFLEEGIKVYFGGAYDRQITNSISWKRRLAKRILVYLDEKHKLTNRMRLDPKTIEINMVHNVSDYLSEVCCLVSPFAVTHFPGPVVEAFSASKAVIVTDVAGINEIVDHNINGLIVPKNDSRALANAINNICSNSDLAIQLGLNGMKKFHLQFQKSSASLVQTCYFNVLK